MAISDYLKTKIADHILRTGNFDKPTVIGVALMTGPMVLPLPEIPFNRGYQRSSLNPADSNWSAVVDGQTTNLVQLNFGMATTSWGMVTHVAIMDSDQYGQGNVLFYGPITSPRSVAAGLSTFMLPGSLTIKLD